MSLGKAQHHHVAAPGAIGDYQSNLSADTQRMTIQSAPVFIKLIIYTMVYM